MDNYVNIFTGMGVLVNRLKSLLEEVKISSIVRDNQESGRLAGFGTPINAVQLFISNTDLEKASTIIEKFKKEIEE